MITILEKIFNFLAQFWNVLNPTIIVKEYERGVILHLGKYARTLNKGFHLKWPVLECSIVHRVTVQSFCCGQLLMTKDNLNVETEVMLMFDISDIKSRALMVEDPYTVVDEIAKEQTKDLVSTTEFVHVKHLDKPLLNAIQSKVGIYGIRVLSCSIVGLQQNSTEILFKNIKEHFGINVDTIESIMNKFIKG